MFSLKNGKLTTDQGLECKTASEYLSKLFGEEGTDQIPDYYLTQCLWYMKLTGFQVWHLAVLIGGNKFRMYRIERDDDLIESIFKQVKAFWFNHVIADVPPDPTCFDDVLHRWSNHVVGKQVEADFEHIKLAEELITVQGRLKADKAREDEIKLKIVSTMQDAEMMISQGKSICTYKEQSSTRIDSTLLKKEDLIYLRNIAKPPAPVFSVFQTNLKKQFKEFYYERINNPTKWSDCPLNCF